MQWSATVLGGVVAMIIMIAASVLEGVYAQHEVLSVIMCSSYSLVFLIQL
jgi:hypothetical protein